MELTKQQIQKVDTFIKSKGVVWYDLRAEVADHFVTAIENTLEKTDHFDAVLKQVYYDFKDVKFKKLIKSKTKAINKNTFLLFKTQLIAFFTFPKIIWSITFFLSLIFLFNWATNKDIYFNTLSVIALLIAVISLIKGLSHIHDRKQSLFHASILQYFNGFNGLFICFNSLNILTKSYTSYEFAVFKIVLFSVFIILITAFYFTYKLMLTEFKKQYPKAIN